MSRYAAEGQIPKSMIVALDQKVTMVRQQSTLGSFS